MEKGKEVPDKIIAVLVSPFRDNISLIERNVFDLIKKPSKTRDWFTPDFYRCLPLIVGNQYGFIVTSEYDFSFTWNGESDTGAIALKFYETEKALNDKVLRIVSHFGEGILTIFTPFVLKTPKGVNLMTINPPNHVVPNITVLTGVVETDNLKNPFTFNLKIQTPDREIFIPKGTPLAGFVPIPRYYADSFTLELSEEVLDETTIQESLQALVDTVTYRREVEATLPNSIGRLYYKGEDVYGNKFPDHQKP